MSAKPTTLPRWSELVGNYQIAGANETVPISAKQDSGWIPGEEPPAGYLNWYQRVVYDWIQWLNDSPAFVPVTAGASALNAFGNGGGAGIAATGGATGGWGGSFQGGAGSGIGSSGTGGTPNGAGQSGQGAGTGAGVQGTGGATGPGLKGIGGTNSAPLNLVPRTLPSTLGDGDIWATTASLFTRINGVTKDLLAVAPAIVSWYFNTGTGGAGVWMGIVGGKGSATAVVNPTSPTVGTTELTMPYAGVLKTFTFRTGALTTYVNAAETNTLTLFVRKNGVDQTAGGQVLVIPSGTAANAVLSLALNLAVAAGDMIEMKVTNPPSGLSGTPFPALVYMSIALT